VVDSSSSFWTDTPVNQIKDLIPLILQQMKSYMKQMNETEPINEGINPGENLKGSDDVEEEDLLLLLLVALLGSLEESKQRRSALKVPDFSLPSMGIKTLEG
jgi:hypothetical protein